MFRSLHRPELRQFVYQLGIVVEAVEDLPDEDERHEEEVEGSQHGDPALQVLDQFFPLVDALVVLLQVPLVERRPSALEEQPLDVEPEPLAEEDDVATDARQTQANRQKLLVDQSHLK